MGCDCCAAWAATAVTVGSRQHSKDADYVDLSPGCRCAFDARMASSSDDHARSTAPEGAEARMTSVARDLHNHQMVQMHSRNVARSGVERQEKEEKVASVFLRVRRWASDRTMGVRGLDAAQPPDHRHWTS